MDFPLAGVRIDGGEDSSQVNVTIAMDNEALVTMVGVKGAKKWVDDFAFFVDKNFATVGVYMGKSRRARHRPMIFDAKRMYFRLIVPTDRVEAALTSIGITLERVKALRGEVVKPDEIDCAEKVEDDGVFIYRNNLVPIKRV